MITDSGHSILSGNHLTLHDPGSRGGLMPSTRNRDEVPHQFKWDLRHIYPSWEAWESGLAELKTVMKQVEPFKGTLMQGPEQLAAVHRLSDRIGILSERLALFASLNAYQDTRDNNAQARFDEVRIALTRFAQATAWFTPEMLSIPLATMRQWIDQTPDMQPHRFNIEELYRKQQHVLDEEGERLMALSAPLRITPDQTYSMLADADVVFPTITLTDGREVVASYANYLQTLFDDRSQENREAVFKAHIGVYSARINTHAAIYNAQLQRDWFVAQARHYPSTLALALDEDNIPTAVVETLIDTAKRHSEPLRRYQQLRRKVLGVERYRYFDAYLPLLEIEWKIPYHEAAQVVIDSSAVFGSEYAGTVAQAFEERWIDVYENEGKRSGAFSASTWGVHPYMLLNYNDTPNSAFTLAHEMGHTMHSELTNSRQPYPMSNYSLFVAEVASMTAEDFFFDRLLELEKDPRRRITLLQLAIDDIAASFYRQVMFADFELEAHRAVERGEPITADRLGELYLQSMAAFFGDSLDDQQWYRDGWSQVPHFYGTPYYVFKYATSKAASSLLHRQMTSDDPSVGKAAVQRYLDLLTAGGSDHPIELLRRAGVDLSTAEPISALVATTDELVTSLETELKTLGLV